MPGPRRDKAIAWAKLEGMLEVIITESGRLYSNRTAATKDKAKEWARESMARLKSSGRLDAHQVYAIKQFLRAVRDLFLDEIVF